jgi:hypothetical protein
VRNFFRLKFRRIAKDEEEEEEEEREMAISVFY